MQKQFRFEGKVFIVIDIASDFFNVMANDIYEAEKLLIGKVKEVILSDYDGLENIGVLTSRVEGIAKSRTLKERIDEERANNEFE